MGHFMDHLLNHSHNRQLQLFIPEQQSEKFPSLSRPLLARQSRKLAGPPSAHNQLCICQPFALKLHRTQKDHLDLRLCNHELAPSWALYQMPSYCPELDCGAIQMEDHLRENIGFEGVHPPEGKGAGPVIVVDQGIWHPAPEFADITASLRNGRIKFTFDGRLMRGLWSLTRQKSCFRPQNPRWILKKEPGNYARREDRLKRIDATKLRSCRTGLSIEEMEREWYLGTRRFRRGASLFAS